MGKVARENDCTEDLVGLTVVEEGGTMGQEDAGGGWVGEWVIVEYRGVQHVV